jgi:hypothetical protein
MLPNEHLCQMRRNVVVKATPTGLHDTKMQGLKAAGEVGNSHFCHTRCIALSTHPHMLLLAPLSVYRACNLCQENSFAGKGEGGAGPALRRRWR